MKLKYFISVLFICFLSISLAAAGEIIDTAYGEEDVAIHGVDNNDRFGHKVASGDINGDGLDDMIVTAYWGDGPNNARNGAGEAYIFYGQTSFPSDIYASGSADAVIYGQEAADQLGYALACGDINGDGYHDIILGADAADGPSNSRSSAGEVYIVFGDSSLPKTIDLVGASDVTIYGADAGDAQSALGLRSGDVNSDGIDDVIICMGSADGQGNLRSGSGDIYIIFGNEHIPTTQDLRDGADIIIYGAEAGDYLINGDVGNFNGDSYNDLIVAAAHADGPSNSRSSAGEAYVILGSSSGPSIIDLSSSADTLIYGPDPGDELGGETGTSTGDVNGDGFSDILLGAYPADGPDNNKSRTGEVHIIYGGITFPETMDLATQKADLTIYGVESLDDYSQFANAGDLNRDGYDDIVAAAPVADGPGNSRASGGEIYVIYGGPSLPETIDMSVTSPDVLIYGADYCSVLSANIIGDFNGDNCDDLLMGAYNCNTSESGDAYIVFGQLIKIDANIDFEPDTLHLKSKAKWMTCYIELPEGYSVDDIDISTVTLSVDGADPIYAQISPTKIGDYDKDGISDLMVKFDRSSIHSVAPVGDAVPFEVSGGLYSEEKFSGMDYVRVIG